MKTAKPYVQFDPAVIQKASVKIHDCQTAGCLKKLLEKERSDGLRHCGGKEGDCGGG